MSKRTMMGADGRLYTLLSGSVSASEGPPAVSASMTSVAVVVNDMAHSSVCFAPK